ncbi:hypothetical protein BaRGS_00030554 [Batillaria attramentaria]|uniref:Uncharacterized protein n=1 Tax=Batillaria attramentaria TaxID=370345 RepID=A0ABD0JT15_9CAEN
MVDKGRLNLNALTSLSPNLPPDLIVVAPGQISTLRSRTTKEDKSTGRQLPINSFSAPTLTSPCHTRERPALSTVYTVRGWVWGVGELDQTPFRRFKSNKIKPILLGSSAASHRPKSQRRQQNMRLCGRAVKPNQCQSGSLISLETSFRIPMIESKRVQRLLCDTIQLRTR